MLKYDIIIILAADTNLPGFGWGFIEEHYKMFGLQEDTNPSP